MLLAFSSFFYDKKFSERHESKKKKLVKVNSFVRGLAIASAHD
jgi:hypothetical protein